MTGAKRLFRSQGLPLSAAALFLLLSTAYIFSIDIRASRGASISGDEPFYLLTTQSLLQDGDLDLANQYEARSYRSFFDHPDGLWKQSVPTGEGKLLSPHSPGLSVLLAPGFILGGLVGAQTQLLLTASGAMVLAFLLAERLTGRRAICWAMTLAVGLSATAFIYSTEIYPEFPAALALLACLLVATGRRRPSLLDGLCLAAGLSAFCWLGLKYAPLGLLVAGYFLYRTDVGGRVAFLTLGATSVGGYIWFHLATFEGLTPYNVNLVYAGSSSLQLVNSHIEFGDRFYRLWGLFVDRRFGVGRWAPILLAAVPGLVLLVLGNGWRRLIFGLTAIQILIAAFVALTMMGWWFPGRTLLTVLPLLVIPLVLVFERVGAGGRTLLVGLAIYSVVTTAGLAQAGHAGEVTIAVDPFDMSFPPFQLAGHAFPNYTFWTGETRALTALWLAAAGVATLGLVLAGGETGLASPSRWFSRCRWRRLLRPVSLRKTGPGKN